MNCEFRRGRVIDLARGDAPDNEVTNHLKECPDCAHLLDEQRALTHTLQQIAREGASGPPENLEAFLLREFDASRPAHRRYWRTAAACGAVAAAVAGFALLQTTKPRIEVITPVRKEVSAASPPPAAPVGPVAQPVRPRPRHLVPTQAAEDPEPFVVVPYTLPLDPQEPFTVMRVAMPVTALVAIGMAAAAPDPSALAQADVLVSEDGRIRALRLVSFESSNSAFDRRTNP